MDNPKKRKADGKRVALQQEHERRYTIDKVRGAEDAFREIVQLANSQLYWLAELRERLKAGTKKRARTKR